MENMAELNLKQIMSKNALKFNSNFKGGTDLKICRFFANGAKCPQVMQYGSCNQTHSIIVKEMHEVEISKGISEAERSERINSLLN